MAAVKQLVVRSDSHGRRRQVEAVDASFLGAPALGDYDYTPVFGTPDLIDLAFALRDADFEIVGTGLADDNLNTAADEDDSPLERKFTKALQSKDSGEIAEMLDDAPRGLRLGFIDVVTQERARFTLSRDGSIRVQGGSDETPLLSVLSDYIAAHG